MSKWVGIDYGSKLAGTTVICYSLDDKLHLIQSEKKADADAFVSKFILEHEPDYVYLDAPLSLPGVYNGNGDDYFYRACDKATKAMSPMFLGGLTARAMKLKASLPIAQFRESYPAYFIKVIKELGDDYGKRGPYTNVIAEKLVDEYGLVLHETPSNWHQLDALACYVIGLRHGLGDGQVLGRDEEGLIFL